MTGRLVVVTGTGTSIGKTHCSEALLLALQTVLPRVAGIKPVETGEPEGGLSDADRLRRSSSFHVKHGGYQFSQPVSPHLAARKAGQPIHLGVIAKLVEQVRAESDVTLLELAGGLFTPLSESFLNVDVVLELKPDVTLLVAPDRLGALHDVLATTRAARSVGASIAAMIIVAPAIPDSSTGLNAPELLLFFDTTTIVELRRAAPAELAREPGILALVRLITTR